MDYIIQSFGNDLTREKIAQLCQVFACTDRDAIWVVPYYSIFEKKYVYLPAHFIEQIYCANGCCAGNTREEALVHGLSEILERHNTIDVLTSGKAVPKIPESVIRQFPVASKILDAVNENPLLDLDILDFSQGLDYPVIATRLINKVAHGYHINVGCDPIFEIALDRTLTEIFQGRNLTRIGADHTALVYEEMQNLPMEHNVFNQLERGNGIFFADFFIDDSETEHPFKGFTDHRDKTNKELLDHVLDVFRKLNRPIYVRNCSYLGFPSYFMIVPGFSETRGLVMLSPVNDYAMGDAVRSVFRNPEAANIMDLQLMMNHYRRMTAQQSKINQFGAFAGLPMDPTIHAQLTGVTLAYTAYKFNKFTEAINYLNPLAITRSLDNETRDYFACVVHYLKLKLRNIEDDKITRLLKKFYVSDNVDKLLASIRDYGNPLHPYLLRCDTNNCNECYIRKQCYYANCSRIYKALGERYRTFTDGQNEKEFI
jgi:ribosomal protein S12 methylthiotransferase accessory factor